MPLKALGYHKHRLRRDQWDISVKRGAKAAVQIKSLKDRPITIQQHTPSERHRERREGGRREKGKVAALLSGLIELLF